MLQGAILIAGKDVRLLLFRRQGLIQAVLLGLLLIFLFSLAVGRSTVDPIWQATIFWIASSFSLVLIFNSLYALEEESGAREALLLAPHPVQSIWLGKALAGGALLLLVQLIFLPTAAVFLQVGSIHYPLLGLLLLLAVNAGLVILGSLFGAIGQGQGGKESLLSVILFPLQLPVLMAGIFVGAALVSPEYGEGQIVSWYKLILAFDAVFLGAALILFPFVYTD